MYCFGKILTNNQVLIHDDLSWGFHSPSLDGIEFVLTGSYKTILLKEIVFLKAAMLIFNLVWKSFSNFTTWVIFCRGSINVLIAVSDTCITADYLLLRTVFSTAHCQSYTDNIISFYALVIMFAFFIVLILF